MPEAIARASAQAARRRVLYCIQELSRTDPDLVADILEMPAADLIPVLDRAAVRLSGAGLFTSILRNHGIRGDLAEDLLNLVRGMRPSDSDTIICSQTKVNFIGESLIPAGLFQDRPVTNFSSDLRQTCEAYRTGFDLLVRAFPTGATLVSNELDVAIGIDGPRGETQSFSSQAVPGFVAFAMNNPPSLIAEQLVHEAAHVRLNRLIEENAAASELFSTLPACYSPFTRSVRTTERVLHGLVSYGMVAKFWQQIRAQELDDGWFDDHSNLAGSILKRLDEVGRRIQMAAKAMTLCLRPRELEIISQIHSDIVGDSLVFYARPDPPSRQPLSDHLNSLTPVTRAEALLAHSGAKCSRISVKVKDHALQEQLLLLGLAHCYSSIAFLPSTDERTGGFSNTFAHTRHLLDASEEWEVLCYLGHNGIAAREALDLDVKNAAGTLFGIPDCCEAAFHAGWSKAVEDGGDLFARQLRATTDKVIKFSWENNFASLYFGAGLCWHFPCSLDCAKSAETVALRREQLNDVCPTLCDEMTALQKRPFVWSADGRYGLLPVGGSLETKLSDVRWSFDPPMFEQKTVSALLDGGDWRLAHPC